MALTNFELKNLKVEVGFYTNEYKNKPVINGRFIRESVNESFSVKYDGKAFYRKEKNVESHNGILTGWEKQSVKEQWVKIDKNHPDAIWWKKLFISNFRDRAEARDRNISSMIAEKEKYFGTLKKKLLEAHKSFNGVWGSSSDYTRMVELRKLFNKVGLAWPSEIVEYEPEAQLETFEYVESNASGDAAIEAEEKKIDEMLNLLGIKDADLEEDENGNLYHTKSDFKLEYLDPNGFRIQMTMMPEMARKVRSILR